MAMEQFEMALSASRSNSEYLFPTVVLDGRDAPMIPDAISRAMNRLAAELKIVGIGPHDLRRTVGTQLAMLGAPLHVRALVLATGLASERVLVVPVGISPDARPADLPRLDLQALQITPWLLTAPTRCRGRGGPGAACAAGRP